MENQTIKIVLIGDKSVGKTALIHVIQNKTFDVAKHTPSWHANFTAVMKGDVILTIWDTPGTLIPLELICRDADMVLICFDLTNGESFNSVEEWADHMSEYNAEVPLSIVGTKADLKRVISSEQGHRLADRINARYFETSSKDSLNVSEMVSEIIQMKEQGLAEDKRRYED